MVDDLVMAHSAAAFLASSLLQHNGQVTTLKGFQAMVSVAKDVSSPFSFLNSYFASKELGRYIPFW